MNASKLTRIILESETTYCDTCGDELGFEHRLDGEKFCKDCAAKKRNKLEDEWNLIYDQIEAGQIPMMEGHKKQHEILMQILDLEMVY